MQEEENSYLYRNIHLQDEFSHLSPEDFVIKVLLEKTGMKVLVVGDDCGFGYKRQGNVELLERMSKEYDFKLIVIPKLELKGEIVSSTRIRRLLSEGKVEEANRLMEDPFMICGLCSSWKSYGSRSTSDANSESDSIGG